MSNNISHASASNFNISASTYNDIEADLFTTLLPVIWRDPKWVSCQDSRFGTMLMDGETDDWITPASVLIEANNLHSTTGIAGVGAPSDQVRDEWFENLPGWTRIVMRGEYEQLENIHDTAVVFEMEDMYECFGYGPESAHQANDEALDPQYYVPMAKALADEARKCLVYGPAVQDYEDMSTIPGESKPRDGLLGELVSDVAPNVDVWMIQLAKYQLWVDGGHDDDGNPFTWFDLTQWASKWVNWIKTANPDAEVWVQLGVGKYDPLEDSCVPPQPPGYILDFRQTLTRAGIDGIFVMPAQPCTPCPEDPLPGFPCSDDPQDHEYYLQSLAVFQEAVEIACTGAE